MLKKLPLFAILPVIVRLTIFGATVGDSLVVVALSAIVCAQMYLDSKKQDPASDTLKQDVEQLKTSVAALKIGRTFGK